ncbi:cobalt transporter subunit CbtA [Devosia lucknowensis]|uniref:Cobalt transporter subunit CbtA n=1 Tax=Devosia lucknowensis TaxID=1096929 RepID=A0A1Y6EDT6_9HYPH|nr:CbtA family protein [Devosia lucknowensis]SMQ59331.1 cobalt transporter subunit CbtA [Devosia lucknowensis]
MFRNLFFAALVAALCAGLATSAFQAWRVTPLIFAAESFEGSGGEAHVHAEGTAAHEHDDAAAVSAHEHGDDEWMPQDGLERTAFTVFSNILMAAGYALIIGAVSVLFNLPVTFANGLLWGVGGFAAFTLAPALGLPPGMPGMPVADTLARQIWWFSAAIGTGAALVLVAKVRAPWALAVAVALILLPQLIAAPQAPDDPTGVPPRMTAEFVSAVLYNGALFWVVLGLAFGWMADFLAARPAPQLNGAKA